MLFKYCWIKLLVLEIVQSSNQIGSTDFLYQDNLVCYEYLVSGTKYNVPDEQLNASSQYDTAKWGRLNTVYVKGKHIGGWEADNNTKPPHYIEIRFNELTIIQAIATQGRNISGDSAPRESYVTKYQVYYRLDDTTPWAPVRAGPGQEPKVFQGNNDSNSIRTNKMPCAVQARAVRIRVNESLGNPSMRFDVRGCPVSQVNLSPDCDFEDSFCGWKQEYDNDSVNWEIKGGATSVSKLLKLHDHTRKHETGLFAYLKSISSPDGSRRNRSAQLVTMIWRSNSTRCLHLWHSGSDPSFGLLTLYVIGCENESEICIAKHVRDLTQEWSHISLDVSFKDYRLIIEGTVTSEDEGYLAIDDISLMKGYCSDCTFENGFCNWKNEHNSWTWIVHESQTYIVIIGENKNTSTKAILLGPEVNTGYISSCLSFSYNLSGDENNSLSALLLLTKTTTLGKLHGEDYDGWRNAFYEIVNNGEKYRIQFLADVTTGFIGLDNISLIFEPCPSISTTIAAPSILSTASDLNTTIHKWSNRKSEKREKDNKTSKVLVGVAVGVGVLGLSVLIVIGIYVGRRRPFRSSAATTTIETDLKMALRNEMSIDTGHEYAYVMAGKSVSVSPDPIYDNNQGVQSTHQNRSMKEERGHAVVSTPKRKIAQDTQEEQIYDHLDTGEKVPRLDDETYAHVKK